jgi:quercetin dioxygenase-like cupin family protein
MTDHIPNEQTTIADGQVLGIIGHHFGGQVYIKEMRLKENAQIRQHRHEFDHLSYLVSGCVIVEVDDELITYYAPRAIPIPAHKQHSVTPVNGDAVWLCIWRTDVTDIDSVDEVLIEKSA